MKPICRIISLAILISIGFSSCKKDDLTLQGVPSFMPASLDKSVYTSFEYFKTDSFHFDGTIYPMYSTGNEYIFILADGYNIYVAKYDTTKNITTFSQINPAIKLLGNIVTSSGDKILFAGTDTTGLVNIYDIKTSIWTTGHLSQPRSTFATTSLGNLVFFAGGFDEKGFTSKAVDIYNVTTGKWTTNQLSIPRVFLAAASAGNKVIFAGGMVNGGGLNDVSLAKEDSDITSRVDIYDAVTGKWSISKLNSGRYFSNNPVAASSGDKIIIAGGMGNFGASDEVDIYNTTTGSWTVQSMGQGKNYWNSTTVGNFVFFTNSDYSILNSVDVFNTLTGQWSKIQFSKTANLGGYLVASSGNKAFFVRLNLWEHVVYSAYDNYETYVIVDAIKLK
jgi:kelch-like protein 20